MEHKNKVVHFLHIPWTGLGLYGGFRGNRWLRNRIKIFKQFVLPSILKQSNQDFIVWCAWRYEERQNPIVKEFVKYLDSQPLKVVHTYAGICFWDDKYPDPIAHDRLASSLHGSMGPLLNFSNGASEVLMTIQPSDDVYHTGMVDEVQKFFSSHKDTHVFGYRYGYVMDYLTGALKEWNPKTTPPFYTIRFPIDIFQDPNKHMKYTGPYKSHEYVKDYLKAEYTESRRGFVVGTHGENISTIFYHPYAGTPVPRETLKDFGIYAAPNLKLPWSLRKWFMRQLPHRWRRKIRYIFGELFAARIYDWLRS